MTPMLRRFLALALVPLSAAGAAPCNVTDRTLLGSWEAVGKGAAFEQMAFERDGSQREFNSWRHERPEVSQAQWHLQECQLTIREPSGVTQTFTVLFRGKRLSLAAAGGRVAGSYRKIEEPGQGPTSAAQPSARPDPLAQSVGVQLQSGYAGARARLLRTSWKPDASWGESGVSGRRAYPQYPEVVCGQGYDAACTGRFEKAGQAILLTIDPRTSALRVTSIDRD